MPPDYLLNKKKYTQQELYLRFQHAGGRQIFNKNKPITDKDGNQQVVLMPVVQNELFDFEIRVGELRLFIIDLSIPRVRAAFVKRFKQLFPHLAHLVDSVEDFEHWYRAVEYTKEVRRVVHIVITSLFTSELFKQIDKEIRTKIGIEYTKTLVNGNSCKTNRSSGFCKSIANGTKHYTVLDRVKRIGIRDKKEIPYERWLIVKAVASVIAKVIKVTEEEWGFNGYLGLTHDHPIVAKERLEAARVAIEMECRAQADQEAASLLALAAGPQDFESFFKQKLRTGADTSSIYKEWEEKKASGKNTFVVSIDDSNTANSPLSDSTGGGGTARESRESEDSVS